LSTCGSDVLGYSQVVAATEVVGEVVGAEGSGRQVKEEG
jgi:hypothetical protein